MKIFNTLTMQKEEFKPLEDNKVKIYACGPTVYNYFHLGNARPFIIFDTLRRYFEYRGYEVKFVQNFTDIDDKMIKRANEEGITVRELADRFIKEYYTDAKGLGVQEANVHPRATDVIPQIIKMCETLIEKGYAYEANGDVYFETKKFKDYGKLSHQPLEDLEAGARINVNEDKKDPMDFAIWKAKKEGEPSWTSPWGEGRPGWHIECSAMVNEYLGKTIDIHCGGKDLSFPHHENEIAQSECANGCKFAKHWFHIGFVNVNNEKMSKSKNNFFTVRDLAKVYGYLPLRYFAVSAHYRMPINYEPGIIEQAKASLERIHNCLANLKFLAKNAPDTELNEEQKAYIASFDEYRNRFEEAMDDDLNTANAITAIFDLIKQINVTVTDGMPKAVYETLLNKAEELVDVLGLLPKEEGASDEDAAIDALIEERTAARKAKDWAKADAIRDQLTAMGIILEDTPSGIRWKQIEK